MPGADIDPRARLGPGVSVWHLAQIREGAEIPSNGWTQQRQQNAKFLDANLRGVVLPPVADGAIHVYHQYTIRVPDDRDGFARALAGEHGIGTGVYYPIPTHRLPSFRPRPGPPPKPTAPHARCSPCPCTPP